MARINDHHDLRLFDELEAGVVVADSRGTIVAWNQAATRILGPASEEAVGRAWSDLITIHHGGVTTVREVAMGASLPGGWHGLVECQVEGHGTVRIRVHLQRVARGHLFERAGHMAVFWPTRDQGRHLRSSRKGSGLPYASFFRRSPLPLALANRDGLLLDVNEAAAELFGIAAADALGHSYRGVLEGWTEDDARECRESMVARGYFERDTIGRRRDGSTFPVELVGTLMSFGGADYVLVRLHDLTRVRRLERMLDDLRDLTRLSEEPRDARDVAQRALTIVAEASEAEFCVLLLNGPDGIRTVPGLRTPEAVRAAFGGIDPLHAPLARHIAQAARPLEIELDDQPSAPPWADRLRAIGLRTLRSTPMWFGERQVGAIVLLWTATPRIRFDDRQLEHMGRLAGVAIGNAELREQTRRESELRANLEGSARIAGVVMAQMSDCIVTTNRDRRITAVNPAAERHYGFSADEAIGRRFDEIIDTLRTDGQPLRREAMDEASAVGYWQGRVLHRPRVGSLAGRSLVLDVSMTAIRDDRREPAGLIILSREVTASARLASEAEAMSSLAVATGRARSRHEVAGAALERLCEAMFADAGIVISYDGDASSLDAVRGISAETAALVGQTSMPSLIAAIDEPGAIVPLDQAMRFAGSSVVTAVAERERIAAGVFVGLRVRDHTYGLLGIGSRDATWAPPSQEVILQAASQVASALEIARLMERLEQGLQQERRLTAQLETLIGVTQLPQGTITEHALGEFLLERVIKTLDAVAGFVVKPLGDGFDVVAVNEPDGVAGTRDTSSVSFELDSRTRSSYYFWRRLEEGSGPFYVSIDGETVSTAVVDRLRGNGFNTYAAFPVREGGVLVAAFVCHFARTFEQGVAADARTLDAIGRILEIAYTNSLMGEGLAEAVEHERRLAAELRALQELTLLGASSDDLARLARETIESVVSATGASGGGYLLLDEASAVLEPIVWVGEPPADGGAAGSTGTAAGAARVAARQDGLAGVEGRANGLAGVAADWPPFRDLCAGAAVWLSRPEQGTGAGPSDGGRAVAALSLRVDDRLAGALQLEWTSAPQREEFDVHFLEPIARIASISLANFRLRSELIERAAAQRSISHRLDALDELTRIGEEASSFEELAHRTVNLVRDALGASGVSYVLMEAGRHFETHAVAGETGAFRLWLKGVPAQEAPGGSVLLSGGGSVLGQFVASEVSERVLPLARAAGFRSFGAIPIRTGDELAGALLCFFDQPKPALPLDESALDSVARIAGIALANFRLRERLVSSEERYRTLFEESPDALFVSALDGTVLDTNEAAVRLYRVNRGEILGRYFGQLLTADEREMARRRQIVWAQGRLTYAEHGRRPDGSEFPVEVEVRVVELGGQRRFLSLIRDLSDQERLQRELLQAQKMEALGQLVSGVAHELNNPLAAIIAFSQLLRRDPRLPDDMKHDAGLLVQEADRTRRIVQNLLDFARQRPPERRPTKIAMLVQSVLELQSYALSTNRIQVALDIPETLPEVDLDRAQLQQVLLNLTINSIQAMKSVSAPVPSHLWIHAELADSDAADSPAPAEGSAGPRVRITIRDDGPGVPHGARGRLFDPFFTTKQPGEGTGLGLSVSFGIIAAHGGQLWYEPGPGDVGSCFIIELPVRARVDERRLMEALQPTGNSDMPVADRPAAGATRSSAPAIPNTQPPQAVPTTPPPAPVRAAPAGPAAPSAPPAAPATSAAPLPARQPIPPAHAGTPGGPRPQVLVLDDEPSIRAFLNRALTVAGMECIPFQDGAQALEQVNERAYDVMLIDHRMAGMSGTEFYEAAVRIRPELAHRAVFMSGDVLNPDLRGFATERSIRLLAKPFDIDAVTRVVGEALADMQGGATGPDDFRETPPA